MQHSNVIDITDLTKDYGDNKGIFDIQLNVYPLYPLSGTTYCYGTRGNYCFQSKFTFIDGLIIYSWSNSFHKKRFTNLKPYKF